MLAIIARVVVIVLGGVISALCVWGSLSPPNLLQLVRRAIESRGGIYFAVAVRIVLGLALIYAAPQSRFPRVLEVLGWIAIAAAVGLAILGRTRMLGFVAWYESLPQAMIRLWLVAGLAFGGLLIYGVW